MSEENINQVSIKQYMAACHDGNLNIVKLYVEQGGDIHVRTSNGNNGFSRAIYKGHIEVAKYLLENGADINAQSAKGKTPLHRAIIRAQWESIKFLIENGADVNIQDECGDTPLHYAARFNYNKVAKLLIEYGARDDIINHKEKTASYEEKFPTLGFEVDFAVYRNMWEQSTSLGQFAARCLNFISNPLYSDELGSIEDMFKAKSDSDSSEVVNDSEERLLQLKENFKKAFSNRAFDPEMKKALLEFAILVDYKINIPSKENFNQILDNAQNILNELVMNLIISKSKQFTAELEEAISKEEPGSQMYEALTRWKVRTEEIIKDAREGNLDSAQYTLQALVDAREGKFYTVEVEEGDIAADSSSVMPEEALNVGKTVSNDDQNLAGKSPDTSEDINYEFTDPNSATDY